MEDDEKTVYLVIVGNHTSCKTPLDYVEHIVYGNPRIDVVEVGSKFVALAEYSGTQWTAAKYTFERMGSFPHGVTMTGDLLKALQEFGTWVRYHAPGTIVGFREETRATQAMVADMEAEGLL